MQHWPFLRLLFYHFLLICDFQKWPEVAIIGFVLMLSTNTFDEGEKKLVEYIWWRYYSCSYLKILIFGNFLQVFTIFGHFWNLFNFKVCQSACIPYQPGPGNTEDPKKLFTTFFFFFFGILLFLPFFDPFFTIVFLVPNPTKA